MSVQEETLKFIVKEEGADQALTRLQAQLARVESGVQATAASARAGAMTWEEFGEEAERAGRDAAALRAQIELLERAQGKVRGTTRQSTQGFLDLSRAFQDLAQGGPGAVVNNLEGVGRAINNINPGSIFSMANMPAILMAVGSAAVVAWPHIRDLVKSMNAGDVKEFRTSIEQLQARIKELEGKEVRIAVEDFELDRAKEKLRDLQKEQAKFNELAGKQNHLESASGRAIEEMLTEAPGGLGAITDEILRAREGRGELVGTPDQQAKKAQLNRRNEINQHLLDTGNFQDETERQLLEGEIEFNKKQLMGLANDIRNAERDAIKSVVGKATGGRGAEQKGAQQQLANELAKTNRGALAAQVAGASPEGMARLEEIDADFERLDESNEQYKKSKKRRQDEAKKAKLARDKVLDEWAKAVGGGGGGTAAMRDGFTPEKVEELLRLAGVPAEEAEAGAAEVHRRALSAAFKRVQERAVQDGVALQEARGRILREQDEKEADEARRGKEKEELDAKADAKETPEQRKARMEREAFGREQEKFLGKFQAQAGAMVFGVGNVKGARGRAQANAAIDAQFRQSALDEVLAKDPDMDPERAAKLADSAASYFREAAAKRAQNLAQQGYSDRQVAALMQGAAPDMVGPPARRARDARQEARGRPGGFRSVPLGGAPDGQGPGNGPGGGRGAVADDPGAAAARAVAAGGGAVGAMVGLAQQLVADVNRIEAQNNRAMQVIQQLTRDRQQRGRANLPPGR